MNNPAELPLYADRLWQHATRCECGAPMNAHPDGPDACDCPVCRECGGDLEGDGAGACCCDDEPMHGQDHEEDDR
jgi:hypothetical protein